MRFRTIILPLLLSLLCACGFHLRGTPGPTADRLDPVYIRTDYSGSIPAEVRSQLQLADVEIASGPEQADLVLVLEDEDYQRSILSVSPRTGKVEEYQLTLEIWMSISARDGQVLLGRTRVAAGRDYAFDEDAVLGEFTEEATLREDMTRLVAMRIIRRLNAAASR